MSDYLPTAGAHATGPAAWAQLSAQSAGSPSGSQKGDHMRSQVLPVAGQLAGAPVTALKATVEARPKPPRAHDSCPNTWRAVGGPGDASSATVNWRHPPLGRFG